MDVQNSNPTPVLSSPLSRRCAPLILKLFTAALVLTVTLTGAAEVLKDPTSIVLAFIQDYKIWNDKANAESERLDDSDEATDAAEAEYKKMLKKYCRPDFNGEPIAFASHSSHDPANEKILSSSIDGKKAVIKTKHSYKVAGLAMKSDYEYHLSFDGTRWYLEEVYYVDADGKYEGL